MGRGKNRGRRKRKEQGQSLQWDLSDEELNAALAEMEAGSDRVAAIMGAALVENTLVGCLLTCLKDKSEADKLFDAVRGPLSDFYSKILLGRALGLYGEDIEDALHTVREIRNKFAHAQHSLDFSNAQLSKKVHAKLARFEDSHPDHDPAAEMSVREYFEVGCYSLTVALLRAGNDNLERRATELLQKKSKSEEPYGLGNYLQHLKPSGLKGSG